MDKDSFFTTLKKFSEAFGVAGYEDDIRSIVIDYLKDYADEVRVDSLGSVIFRKIGSDKGHRLMIAAHMDEIGLMVSHISKSGFIYFRPVGGWNALILPGQRVLIKSRDGSIHRGVVGHTPPHILKAEEAKKVPDIDKLYIDIGAKSDEEVSKWGIEIGSPIVIERSVERLALNDVVTGKAFDDRVGLSVLAHVLMEVDNPPVDFYAVATVQEEVGLKGARTSAFSISPHVALALDVTIAADLPGVSEQDQMSKVGKGPSITVMDGRSGSGIIANPHIKRKLVDIAERHNIPYQLEVLSGGTTDASIIALNKEGVPTGVVSIPTRYIHSPVELLSLDDCINTVELVTHFVNEADPKWVDDIRSKVIKHL